MTRIKILYIISCYVRQGPNIVLYNLLKNLDFELFEVYLLTFRAEKPNSMQQDFAKIPGVTFLYIPIKLPFEITKLNKLLVEIHPDIVHSNGLSADILNGFSTNIGQKKISTLHGTLYKHYISSFGASGLIMGAIHQVIYSFMDKVVGCSSSVTLSLTVKKIPAVTILNGISTRLADPSAPIKICGNLAKKRICYVGSIDARKNVATLLKGFLLSNTFEDYELCIVGDGVLKNQLESEYVHQNIHFVGFQANPIGYIQAADFLILPSRYEGLPLVVLESLSVGTPVLLSDIPPHKEIMHIAGKNIGKLFGVSENEIIQMFNMLISVDLIELKLMQANCIAAYNKCFTGGVMGVKYMQLYQNVVNNR